ncbi:hypothetical protein D3C87_1183400 [compost metagenome]
MLQCEVNHDGLDVVGNVRERQATGFSTHRDFDLSHFLVHRSQFNQRWGLEAQPDTRMPQWHINGTTDASLTGDVSLQFFTGVLAISRQTLDWNTTTDLFAFPINRLTPRTAFTMEGGCVTIHWINDLSGQGTQQQAQVGITFVVRDIIAGTTDGFSQLAFRSDHALHDRSAVSQHLLYGFYGFTQNGHTVVQAWLFLTCWQRLGNRARGFELGTWLVWSEWLYRW